MMRKWEFIADQLEKRKAPSKVIAAARSIDETLVNLGLGRNTKEWEIFFKSKLNSGFFLKEVVSSISFCTACQDSCDVAYERCMPVHEVCEVCKLGDMRSCTPRSRYPEDWMKTVLKYLVYHNFYTYNSCTYEPVDCSK